MTAPPMQCPWYCRKRAWAAALLLALPAGYVGIVGTLSYGNARGWASNDALWTAYGPGEVVASSAGLSDVWFGYMALCYTRGARHAASD